MSIFFFPFYVVDLTCFVVHFSQTGSPIMPGPVPSVSTKTRGYVKPPSFHMEQGNSPNNISYTPARFFYPGPTYNNPSRIIPPTTTTAYQNSYATSSWRDSSNKESEAYIPSYQKKSHINPNVQKHYSPVFSHRQSPNLVHRQFNSPMPLYSNDNIQEVMNHHINRIK